MKTKISKILGVGLALIMVFGLAFALVPTQKAEAQLSTNPNQWQVQAIPGVATNSLRAGDVSSLAVANDDATMYAVDATLATGAILKTNSAGAIWAPVTNPPWAAGARARLIAVSPDNPQAIAVCDNTLGTAAFAAGTIYISNNGGTSWGVLPGVPGLSPTATSVPTVTALAVGPTRAGTILGRDYAVAVADATATFVDGGDIFYCGLNTAWTTCVGAGFAIDTIDFTSVAFTPSFVGDRVLMAVGSDNLATPETWLFAIQLSDVIAPANLLPGVYPVQMFTATTDSPGDYDVLGAATQIISSTIALPADFDPTSPPTGIRTFVGWTSGSGPGVANGQDDVYRVDFTTVRKLQSGCTSGIFSIAYSGVIAGGTLVAGEAVTVGDNTTIVWAATDPQLAQPSFVGSAKSPTGATNCNVALVSSDICYAGTGGIESAFSVSTNGGASFNQRGLINTSIDCIQDVYASPDGKTVFMATADNGTAGATGSASDRDSLWKSATPVTSYGWERVRMVPGVGAGDWGDLPGGAIVRLSPEYLDDTALFWCDAGGTAIQRSVTGGDIFSNRIAPNAIADIAVENASIVYMAQAAPATNVYSSTGGAWGGSWSLPVNTTLAPFGNLQMCPSYPEKPAAGNLIGGCVAVGIVGISLDAGASWIPLLPAVPAAGAEQVVVHPDWANRKIVYAGDSTANAGIWRYEFGVSNAWEQIRQPTFAGPMTGMAMAGGTLYGSENLSVERQLYPTLGVADMAGLGWDAMNIGSSAGPARLFNAGPSALKAVVRDSEVNLWTIDTTGNNTAGGAGFLMAYDDTMALATPTATVPAVVAYDPNNLGSAQFTISFPAISNATQYDLYFFTDAACTQFVTAWTAPALIPAPTFTPAVAAAPAATIAAGTFTAGADYWMLVRARNQVPTDLIRSRFSDPIKFTVEIGVPIQAPGVGPVLTSPAPGATDVDAAAVAFSWGTMLQATEYEFILATDSALQNTIAGTPAYVTTPSFGPVTLDAGESYFYAVKVTKPSVSPQSVGSFTTATTVSVWTDPATGLTYPTREALEAAIAARGAPSTPIYIWIVIAIGAILVIAVIWLIFTTRKT